VMRLQRAEHGDRDEQQGAEVKPQGGP
jgi:hypothetical protein